MTEKPCARLLTENRRWAVLFGMAMAVSLIGVRGVAEEEKAAEAPAVPAIPDYAEHVAPLLTKYCVGCHNAEDRQGDLSLESYTDLQQGGEHGPAVLAGQPSDSRLIRLLTGTAEPQMPPDDNEAPRSEEVAILRAWIEAGAKGPAGAEPDRTRLLTPKLRPPQNLRPGITALDWSTDDRLLAVARFAEVELLDGQTQDAASHLQQLPGKVHAVHFSKDGSQLITASGIAGLYGEAALWKVRHRKLELVRRFQGHRDTMYDAVLSGDGKTLATCSYDHKILLWDVASGEIRQTLSGHNGAVYDLAFSPDSTILASASGDETIKLWRVSDGIRLDTLGQPQAEQYCVAFSPDGKFIVGGGADNRIRVWRAVALDQPGIHPLMHSRFAHESAVIQLVFSPNGRTLASAAEDRSLKLWSTRDYTPTHAYPQQPDVSSALNFAAGGTKLAVGRLDGSLQFYDVPQPSAETEHAAGGSEVAGKPMTQHAGPLAELAEQEPNDAPAQAMPIPLPARITGTIHRDELPEETAGTTGDADLFRFDARQGEQWIVEVNAAQSKSPLDSRVEVLTAGGEPIPRVLLQAVRDSYFTFRGKDSDTSDDFRVHNWQEMELNEYLYANGEVVKLWLYPRGPDSGFQVYPGSGKRYTYFDTTANAHPLHEPCYIVKPLPPGSEVVSNGLPVFTLFYENDDDSRRRFASDSKLTFTAPQDGTYLVRLTDVRGFQGSDYHYKLTVRPRQPDFKVTLGGANPEVPAGSGREFSVKAQRMDGFDGPIRVEVEGAPPGFFVTSPIVIEAGQDQALGTIHAAADAPPPSQEQAKATRVTAHALIHDQWVQRDVNNLGEIKRVEKPKLLARITTGQTDPTAEPPALDPARPPAPSPIPSAQQSLELVVRPGETITAKVQVERNGFKGRVSFGNADSGRNLPHGVYVDNIGLNGLLIVEGQDERTFFITAADWVPETTRMFHLKANVEGGQATWPVVLHVQRDP